MKNLHIITPVKDSIDSTIQTIRAVLASQIDVPYIYTIYNDFSSAENTELLEKYSKELGFELVNLADITDHPSPNYLLVLQMAQKRAVESQASLLIVESDVIVESDTIQKLVDGATEREDCGIAASVTVDDNGDIKSMSEVDVNAYYNPMTNAVYIPSSVMFLLDEDDSYYETQLTDYFVEDNKNSDNE